MEITKDMTMREIMNSYPQLVSVLMSVGMMCGSCPDANRETLEKACEVHGLECDELLKLLNSEL